MRRRPGITCRRRLRESPVRRRRPAFLRGRRAFTMKRRYWVLGAVLFILAVALFAFSFLIRWSTQYRVPDSSVSALAFSPDGNTLALGGHPSVKLWDVASRTEKAALAGHSRYV